MTENFGFQKLCRNGGAIHRNQPTLTARCGVDSASHKLFAGPSLAKHENARRRLRDNFNQLFQFFGRP